MSVMTRSNQVKTLSHENTLKSRRHGRRRYLFRSSLSQDSLQQLPTSIPRNCIHKDHAATEGFVLGQTLRTPVLDVRLRHRDIAGSRVPDDIGTGILAIAEVMGVVVDFHADDRGVDNGRVLQDHGFKFGWRDLEPTHFDQLLFTVDHVPFRGGWGDARAFFAGHDVAGSEIAFSIK